MAEEKVYYSKILWYDNPTLTHLLGYLTEDKWASAIRNKEVEPYVAYRLLEIQDEKYNGNLTDAVKELVAMSKEDWLQYMKSIRKE